LTAVLVLGSVARAPHLEIIVLALEARFEKCTVGSAIEQEKAHEIHKLCLAAGGQGPCAGEGGRAASSPALRYPPDGIYLCHMPFAGAPQ
jgi:hypothetical protein